MATFDYSSLPPSDADALRVIAERLRDLIPNATSLVIEIGDLLRAAKSKLEHGTFGQYCLDKVGIEPRTAENYLALSDLAKVYPSSDLAKISARTAYKMAAKSAPADVVEAIMGEVRGGKIPSFNDVQRRLAKSKPVPSSGHDAGDVADLADRLIDALDPRNIGDLDRFLRRGTKRAIIALCDELQRGLERQHPQTAAADMLPKNLL
ncbi:DUF3102 domain-containing protein [Bradyrhizobium sp. C-145]|uniref:DUF3102 domain-containing protein n=1 Tax=Bradyrhizobium sp. C-145 TaxID=574727 RepID=UPI00201B8478|nr:DUF3102 domain-containing protein [Bradyrhizobium sp. C-145]UQR62336.1 DUF3102 domain-containing protein [Bradyrhizobium sp. C-145]